MRNLQGFLDDLRDGNMQFARHPEWYDFTEDECIIIERMFNEMDYLQRMLDHEKRRNRALRKMRRTLSERLRLYQKLNPKILKLAQTIESVQKEEVS